MLRRTLDQGVEWGLAVRHVVDLVDMPRVERKEIHPPTPEQVQQFVGSLKDMPECVAVALRAHRARQAEERLAAGSEWQDSGLVFTTRKGTPIEPRRIDTEFKRILKKAGLPQTIRLHDTRHFAASLLLAQGVHPRTEMMEILGRSGISLTMNICSHIVPE